MGKSVPIFSADFTQPIVNWVLALRGFAGVDQVSPKVLPRRKAKEVAVKKKLKFKSDLKVWFIDDDPINNILNRSLMEDHFPGVQLAVFQDARQALFELGKEKSSAPDIIFLDLNMPGFNGWDFMEVFTASGYPAQVFILTSSIDPEDRNEAVHSKNVSGFYSKPLLPEMIQEALGRVK